MSLNVAALEVLVAKGLTAEDILEVARALDIKKDPTAAERKRRQRAREADDRDMSRRDVTCDPSLSRPPNENKSNPPTHTHPDNNPAREKSSGKSQPIAKPEEVSAQTWADFVSHRKAKRAPVSETVMTGIRREVAKAGWTLEAALVETISRGWQSFKADFVISDRPAANDGGGSFLASLSGPSP